MELLLLSNCYLPLPRMSSKFYPHASRSGCIAELWHIFPVRHYLLAASDFDHPTAIFKSNGFGH